MHAGDGMQLEATTYIHLLRRLKHSMLGNDISYPPEEKW